MGNNDFIFNTELGNNDTELGNNDFIFNTELGNNNGKFLNVSRKNRREKNQPVYHTFLFLTRVFECFFKSFLSYDILQDLYHIRTIIFKKFFHNARSTYRKNVNENTNYIS